MSIFAIGLVLLGLGAAPAAAAGMKLERERQFTVEGPETVGFLKGRFDFQHNFKDYTLNPAVDLTLVFGVWNTVQIEGETLLHNQEVMSFGRTVLNQYNSLELSVKWAVLDQSREDWFSLAVAGTIGRVDTKAEFKDSGTDLHILQRNHYRTLGGYAVLHYDTRWVTPSLQVLHDQWTYANTGRTYALTTPGLGLRLKAWEARNARIHLVADYQLAKFKVVGAHNAWGAGTQLMVGSPHVFSFFVGNTFGDTLPDVVFGVSSTFYNFRWSYRF